MMSQKLWQFFQEQIRRPETSKEQKSNILAKHINSTCENTGETFLMAAVASGDINSVRFILDHTLNVDAQDNKGKTAFWISVTKQQKDIASLLLEHKANINHIPHSGDFSIPQLRTVEKTLAVSSEYELVLEEDYIVTPENKRPESALHVAIQSKNREMMLFLLEAKSDPNIPCIHGSTALIRACEIPSLTLIKDLLDAKADINAKRHPNSKAIETALGIIVDKNSNSDEVFEIASFLIEKKADVNAVYRRDENMIQSLLVAMYQKNDEKMADLLLKAGCNPNVELYIKAEKDKPSVSMSPLHYAVMNSDTKHVAKLLAAKADIEKLDFRKLSPLYLACGILNFEIIKMLVTAGANVNARATPMQIPPIFQVVWINEDGQPQENFKVASYLIEKKADVNATYSPVGHITLLAHAAKLSDAKIVDLILNAGAKTDVPLKEKVSKKATSKYEVKQQKSENAFQKKSRETIIKSKFKHYTICNPTPPEFLDKSLMHYAVQSSNPDIVRRLLNAKVDPSIADQFGLTPLHLATEFGSDQIVKMLAPVVPIDAQLKNGLATPLHLAAKLNEALLIKILIQKKANIEAKTLHGSTPLHIAATFGNVEAIATLTEAKANIHAKNEPYGTPFIFAAMEGHHNVVRYLLNQKVSPDIKEASTALALTLAHEKGATIVVEMILQEFCKNSKFQYKGYSITQEPDKEAKLVLTSPARAKKISKQLRTIPSNSNNNASSYPTLPLQGQSSYTYLLNSGLTKEEIRLLKTQAQNIKKFITSPSSQPIPSGSISWLNGVFTSQHENIFEIESKEHPNCYIYFDKQTLEEQGCTNPEAFIPHLRKFSRSKDEEGIKFLTNKHSILVVIDEVVVLKAKLDCEIKINGIDRVLCFRLDEKDDEHHRNSLLIACVFKPKGLHNHARAGLPERIIVYPPTKLKQDLLQVKIIENLKLFGLFINPEKGKNNPGEIILDYCDLTPKI